VRGPSVPIDSRTLSQSQTPTLPVPALSPCCTVSYLLLASSSAAVPCSASDPGASGNLHPRARGRPWAGRRAAAGATGDGTCPPRRCSSSTCCYSSPPLVLHCTALAHARPQHIIPSLKLAYVLCTLAPLAVPELTPCLLLQGRARRREGWRRRRRSRTGTPGPGTRRRRRRAGGWWGRGRRRPRAAAAAGAATPAAPSTSPSSPAGASRSSTTRRPGAASAATSSSCPDRPQRQRQRRRRRRRRWRRHLSLCCAHAGAGAALTHWIYLARVASSSG
jgi:hypothetical protein